MDLVIGYLMIGLAIVVLVGGTLYWAVKDAREEREYQASRPKLDDTLVLPKGWYKS